MLARLVAAAMMTVGLCAQSPAVVYDNGPFETSPGFSNVDTSTGHTVAGYGGQFTATVDIALFDEFIVATSMVVEEVEFFCYQTGTGSVASTIAAAHIAFYDTDPSQGGAPMVGSPVPAIDMFTTPNNPVSNAWTGIYREIDRNNATNRAIMGVRLVLEDAAGTPTPLTLSPGTYWFRVQSAGSAGSGPWFPPITCAEQAVTGNAMQFIAATNVWENPIQSGSAGAQGLPFKLFGQLATAGSIVQTATGCGSTTLSVCGAVNLGGFIRTELTPSNPVSGIPIIGYAMNSNPTAFCTCTAIHAFPISLWFATESVVDLPVDPGFAGLTIGVQGAEFNGIGPGCAAPVINFTDGYLITINS